jgi:hypothetical protein
LAGGFPYGRSGEEWENGWFPENQTADEQGGVQSQRERDVRTIRVRHEVRWRGIQLRDQGSQVGDVMALGIDVCLCWWGVGRGKPSAVGDDPKPGGERLHLCLKRVQIPQAAMNEDERISLAAFRVVERCLIDLDWLDLEGTRCSLSACGSGRRGKREQREGGRQEP